MATQQTFSFFEIDGATIERPKKPTQEGPRWTPPTRFATVPERPVTFSPAPPASGRAGKKLGLGSPPNPSPSPADSVSPPQLESPAPESSASESSASESTASESTASLSETSREGILRHLRSQVRCISTPSVDRAAVFSTGCAALDQLLPHRGLRLDAFTEWVAETESCGAATLALVAAASLLNSQATSGPLVVVDPEGTFYPPAAVALGVAAERVIWVRPRRHADTVWAIDQSLRCASVAAVWASVRTRLDDRDARRFQLAAETGSTPGLLIRPPGVRGQPSFADARFHVAAAGRNISRSEAAGGAFHPTGDSFFRTWRVTLDRCRGSGVGAGVWIEMDENARLRSLTASEMAQPHETSALHLASRLADPAASRRATRRSESLRQRRA